VKTFLGLSAERAYKRCYPAVDLLLSWSRYFDQLEGWFARHLSPDWVPRVKRLTDLVHRGDAVQQMIQVTGEEGVTLDDFLLYLKAQFLDMVYLQQDAFDGVDSSCPISRQQRSLVLVDELIQRPYQFSDKTAARDFFTRLTGLFKNLNYAPEDSPTYLSYRQQIEELAEAACRPVSTATAPAPVAAASS
jgi:V/A-type H+-transporting ATPase subunit A